LGFESSRSPAKLALRFELGFDESLIRATTIRKDTLLYEALFGEKSKELPKIG
jgi:hypothetical protein